MVYGGIVEEAMLSVRSTDIESSLSHSSGKSVIRDISYLGIPHKVVYRRLSTLGDGGDTTAALVFSTADIAVANRDFGKIFSVPGAEGREGYE